MHLFFCKYKKNERHINAAHAYLLGITFSFRLLLLSDLSVRW